MKGKYIMDKKESIGVTNEYKMSEEMVNKYIDN